MGDPNSFGEMNMTEYFFEAEAFPQRGGWVVDGQSVETMGSAYLMAHGMGVPVEDAVLSAEFAAGTYTVWARCRDWTAPWGIEDPAGKFRILLDGEALPQILGTESGDWAWQKAGTVLLTEGVHEIRLRDLTGFNGRCDCLYFSDGATPPPEGKGETEALRRRLNWKEIREEEAPCDLIVAGGGIAGICTALAALRSGLSVLLIHDREILGGCNSSEVRVCLGGMANLPPYPQIGNVLKEIAPVMGHPTRFAAEYYEDHRKLFAFEASKAEKRVRLSERVTELEKEGDRITAVVTTHLLTGRKSRYRAKLFADCTGDGTLARGAGCEVMYGRESRDRFGESLAPKEASRLVMGHSIRWYSEPTDAPSSFPDREWNLPFDDETCLKVYNGDWEQESGFSRHMVNEIEYIRDFGLRAIFANWGYQKNRYGRKEDFAYHRLKWVSPLGGKRESFRVVGDHVLTQTDVEEHIPYADGTACMSWSIDFHFPEPTNSARFGEPFRSFAYHRGIGTPYPVPYRCLYARDVENLFLGGRLVSASHVAFGSLRVMRTLGQLGEVVGLAAAVCREKNCTPRQVYTHHWEAMKKKLEAGVEIPAAFNCGCEEEEKYHYKDLGWVHIYPTQDWDKAHTDRIRRDLASLGIEHKYPLPEELKF